MYTRFVCIYISIRAYISCLLIASQGQARLGSASAVRFGSHGRKPGAPTAAGALRCPGLNSRHMEMSWVALYGVQYMSSEGRISDHEFVWGDCQSSIPNPMSQMPALESGGARASDSIRAIHHRFSPRDLLSRGRERWMIPCRTASVLTGSVVCT